MKLELSFYSTLCAPSTFNVNDISADEDDFGEMYDTNPFKAEPYGCGDMTFEPKSSTPDILAKYSISQKEYDEICDKLEDGLSFGKCGWCI